MKLHSRKEYDAGHGGFIVWTGVAKN